MFGDKKTLPFWSRRRPSILALERALAPEGGVREERHTDAERAVIEQQLAQHRFEVSKGTIRPPT
ncbi:MAG TPA: hypothetical protein VEC60_05585 [Reyranella sp.]|nr:hypothetical protein [Reyranella sp.]